MNFIDPLTCNVIWTEKQITKRTELMVQKTLPPKEEMILNRKLRAVTEDGYELSPSEQVLLEESKAAMYAAQQAGIEARTQNERVRLVLTYEQAIRDQAALILKINGRDAIPATDEIPEERDPETGEIIQEYSPAQPAIPGIEPLPEIIERPDEFGITVTVPNRDYIEAIDNLAAAEAVIAEASEDTISLAQQRGSQHDL